MSGDDAVTLGEISRRLTDVIEEIRALRNELVRRDVYDANRITDQQRIFSLESRVVAIEDERKMVRRLVYSSLFSAATGAVIAVWSHIPGVH